jgi:hypothetical protein
MIQQSVTEIRTLGNQLSGLIWRTRSSGGLPLISRSIAKQRINALDRLDRDRRFLAFHDRTIVRRSWHHALRGLLVSPRFRGLEQDCRAK